MLLVDSREMFIQEAKEISNMLNGVHHSRKLSHLQVNYPDTVERLSALQATRMNASLSSSQASLFPSPGTVTLLDPKDRVREFKQTKLREYQDAMKTHLIEERLINFRKKEYYREMGRKAVVNQVENSCIGHRLLITCYVCLGDSRNSSQIKRRFISSRCFS